MSELKIYQEFDSCPICGDPLRKINNRIICKCCGFIAPYQYNHGLLSQLEKAKLLRQQNRFQEALEKYEEIIENEEGSLEANYGALLSEYGIEPVKDRDGSYKFTFHRFSYQKIFDTKYYQNIVNNTYGEDNDSYIIKINEIEELREQINEQAKKAKKYDVFLCTKITRIDDPEKKTEEYLWAEAVYRKLKKMGLNVFFSPYSLPATLGSYEVAIFTALKSAKFMIIFASDEENLNSPWPKNEWGRFLKFKKEGSKEDRDKEFKLIVKKDIKLNNRDLMEQDYIKTSNKDWMEQLLQTLSLVFPDILKSKEYVGGTIVDRTRPTDIPDTVEEEYVIDLNDFKRRQDDNDFTFASRPEKVQLLPFGDGFKPIEADEEECIELMTTYLKNGNFRGAKHILKDFKDSRRSNEVCAKLLMLLMFAQVEARSIDEFKLDKIRNFKEYEHIANMMDVASMEDSITLASILSDFILKTIKNEDYSLEDKDHAFNLYKVLSRYDNPIITKLHNQIINSYRALTNDINLLEKYLNIAFPIIASINYPDYLEKASIISEQLGRIGEYKLAIKISDDVLEYEPNHPNALFAKLKAEFEVKSTTDLLLVIEEQSAHDKISEIFKHIDEADAKIYINHIINRIKKLLYSQEYNKVDEWISVISGYNFEGRDELINDIYNICLNPKNKDIIDLYDAIKKTASDKKTFISRTNKFATMIARELGNFEKAKKYYLEVLNYEKNNKHALDGLLITQLEGRYQNIYKLNDFTTLERYINTRESDSDIYEYVYNLCQHCIMYIKKNEVTEDNNVFIVFDKLLTYIPNQYDDDLIKIAKAMSDLLLEKKLFDMVSWYSSIILGIDESNYKAYWNIVLAKCKVSSTKELQESNGGYYDGEGSVYDLEEYKRTIHYAQNTSDLDIYTKIQFKRNKKKSAKKINPLIIVGIAVAVIAIAVAVILLM